MITFRDSYTREIGAELIVHQNREALAAGANPFALGTQNAAACSRRNRCLTRSPRADSTPHSAAHAAMRRKSRAKERIYSLPRSARASGTRRTSAPSCGTSSIRASTRARAYASFRCRTGRSWTSGSTSTLENIPIVPLYFAEERLAVLRGGSIIVDETTAAAAGRAAADDEVPHALAGLRAVHRRHPLRRGYRCRRLSRS